MYFRVAEAVERGRSLWNQALWLEIQRRRLPSTDASTNTISQESREEKPLQDLYTIFKNHTKHTHTHSFCVKNSLNPDTNYIRYMKENKIGYLFQFQQYEAWALLSPQIGAWSYPCLCSCGRTFWVSNFLSPSVGGGAFWLNRKKR